MSSLHDKQAWIHERPVNNGSVWHIGLNQKLALQIPSQSINEQTTSESKIGLRLKVSVQSTYPRPLEMVSQVQPNLDSSSKAEHHRAQIATGHHPKII